MGRRRWITGGIMTVTAALLLLVAAPANAIPGVPGPPPVRGLETDVVMTGTAEGQGVAGSLPDDIGAVSDPGVPYPSTPPADFSPANQGFAGIITAEAANTGTQLRMFCIDIRTSTYPGLGYENGTWEQAGMPNVGYVARLLNEYYPNTGEPAAAPNDNVRAAAVQAAIWYFTDYFVLAPGDPVRPYTEAIVNAIRALPPLPSPTPPSLTITPASTTSPVGTPAGPFTVDTDAPAGAAVFSTGGEMFSDAGATVPVAQGATVPNGQQLWLVPDDPLPGAAVDLVGRGEATVPSGNVYIYDGNTPGVADAQRLILAETVTVVANALAQAAFVEVPLAELVVTKTIAGSAAGSQGAVTLHVSCSDGLEQDVSLTAGATGSESVTIGGLEVGTTCTVTEPQTGASGMVLVTTTGLGDIVIADGGSTVGVTNTYTRGLPPTGGSLPLVAAAASGVLLVGGLALLTIARRRAHPTR